MPPCSYSHYSLYAMHVKLFNSYPSQAFVYSFILISVYSFINHFIGVCIHSFIRAIRRKSISGHTKLLKPLAPALHGRKCLALDLDETLVHSSFEPVDNADFVIPVVIEDVTHHVYVLKRPGVDEFMKRMGKLYEIVIYTASLSKYADPLLDKLDIHNVIAARLFREHCVYFQGHYVKDMSLLNRPINECIIVDNSPMSYAFHPENAIGCGSYINCPKDVEMWQLADFLENLSSGDDVRGKTRLWRQWCSKNPSSVPNK
jgi:carboxy-terminal domain RNA polymerase II polypeptide A small phosphatase